MASQPTLKVEIAMVSDPLTLAPTWVDVSQYVRRTPGVSIRRGRQRELDNFDAGSCHVTLSNRDRRFDPSYSAGPYFGNLLPRKQIRVTATWAAVDYVMFQGWVTGWPQALATPDSKDSTVTIEAVDALAWLASNRLPADLVYSYANTTIGALGFFLRGADTTAWNDAKNAGYGAYVNTGVGSTSTTMAAGAASTAVNFNRSTVWQLANRYTSAASWSISLWMKTTDSDTAVAPALFGGGVGTSGFAGSGPFCGLALNPSTGALTFSWGNGASGAAVDNSTRCNDGVAHHVVITGGAAASRMYVDGVSGNASTILALPAVIDVIGSPAFGATLSLSGFNGSVEDFAVFDKQLSSAEVAGLYARSYGYLEETSDARVTRILDDVGWPATWRTLSSTTEATVGELVYNAATANSLLQEVQRSEQGRIFAGKTNFVTFLERYYTQEQTAGDTVQQIFSDDGGATALPYSSFGFQFNDVDVTNDATVTTPTTYAASSDAASKTTYGLQSQKVDTNLSTFDQAQSMAKGLVARGKTGTYRLSPILIHPVRNTGRWDEVLGLELGHRVSFEITPMAVGSQNAQEVSIESMEWLVESDLWSLVVTGEPVRDVWFIWDSATSLVGGPKVIGY